MMPTPLPIRTIALVSCVKSKRAGEAAAQNLYTSALFVKSRRYAERHADAWFILSALHGLLHPAEVIEPYEMTLKDMGKSQRTTWARQVHGQLYSAGLVEAHIRVMWLAGNAYQQPLRSMLLGQEHLDPLVGLRMGERMSWLDANT